MGFPLHNPYTLYSLLEFLVSTSVLGTWYLSVKLWMSCHRSFTSSRYNLSQRNSSFSLNFHAFFFHFRIFSFQISKIPKSQPTNPKPRFPDVPSAISHAWKNNHSKLQGLWNGIPNDEVSFTLERSNEFKDLSLPPPKGGGGKPTRSFRGGSSVVGPKGGSWHGWNHVTNKNGPTKQAGHLLLELHVAKTFSQSCHHCRKRNVRYTRFSCTATQIKTFFLIWTFPGFGGVPIYIYITQ